MRRIIMSFSVFSYTASDLSLLPRRTDESNKGTYGRVLCVCGSVGMCGAAYLAAKAAYRSGAGLVRILTVRENLIPLQTALPEAIVTTYESDAPDTKTILDSLDWADVIVIGCGIGDGNTSRSVLSTVLRSTDKPRVIDADALNIISKNGALKKYLRGAIITPHPLEMSRLCGLSVEQIMEDTPTVAQDFAKRYGTVCLIKRHKTVISDGGDKIYVNDSGNSGMATAGSGDVLSGIIGGILAQDRDGSLGTMRGACLGAYIHGLCGDAAARRLGEYSMMASDMTDALPAVLKDI